MKFTPESIFFLMLFWELQSKELDGTQILFESETISQEWPVVIICSKYFTLFKYNYAGLSKKTSNFQESFQNIFYGF